MDLVSNLVSKIFQTSPFMALFVVTLLIMVDLLLVSVLVVWIARKLRPGISPRWYTAAYLVASLPALLWSLFLILLYTTSDTRIMAWPVVMRQDYAALYRWMSGPEDWFMLPALSLFLLFAGYVLVGVKGEPVYENKFRSHRLGWLVLGLLVLFVTWLVSNPEGSQFLERSAAFAVLFLFGSLTLICLDIARVTKARKWYVLAVLPAIVWLLAPYLLSVATVTTVFWPSWLRQMYITLRLGVEDWFMLPAILLFLVFTCYVVVGVNTGDEFYNNTVKPRRSVWLVFGLVVLFVTWFVPTTLLNAQSKFTGVHVDLTYIGEAIKDMRSEASRLLPVTDKPAAIDADQYTALQKQTDDLSVTFSRLRSSIWADAELLGGPARAAGRLVNSMAAVMGQELSPASAATVLARLDEVSAAATAVQSTTHQLALAAMANGAESIAQQANALEQQFAAQIQPQIAAARDKVTAVTLADTDALTGTVQVAQLELTTLQQLVGTAESSVGSAAQAANLLTKLIVATGPNLVFDTQSRVTLMRTINQMQAAADDIRTTLGQLNPSAPISSGDWRLSVLDEKIRTLDLAMAGLAFDSSTPLLMVALVFVVFLLMPWLLYLSFIVYKREQIVKDCRDLLEDLHLLERFRTVTSLSNDPGVQGANKAREFVSQDMEDRYGEFSKIMHKSSRYLNSATFRKLAGKMNRQRELTPADREEIILLADTEVLSHQAFYSVEYLIPLLILTALTLVGWYYIVFAGGTNGLVNFIEQGGSSPQLANLLAQFTPFTMVFAGAWLFMLLMLTYRWVSDDLTPQAYFYAATRMVYGLLVGMVFLALFGKETSPFWLLLAFFVGTAPIEFVKALWRSLKDSGSWLKDRHIDSEYANPIVKYFDQPDWGSRQPLTDLEDLTIWDDTRFYQEGIQNIHALATADLMRLAIRTPYAAQTLVDWVDQALLRIHTKVLWHAGLTAIGIRSATDLFDSCVEAPGAPGQAARRPEKLARVVNAFNAAQLMSIGTGDPRLEAYSAAADLEAAVQKLVDQTKAVKEAAGKLDPATGTLKDANATALDGALGQLIQAVDGVEQARTRTREKLGGLAAQQTPALREAQKQVTDLTTNEAKSTAEAAEKMLHAADEGTAASSGQPAGANVTPAGDKAALDGVKEKAAVAVQAAETLAAKAKGAAEEAMSNVLPLRLTAEILEVMLTAMERNPNIHYIRHYWDRQAEKMAAPDSRWVAIRKLRLQAEQKRLTTLRGALPPSQ